MSTSPKLVPPTKGEKLHRTVLDSDFLMFALRAKSIEVLQKEDIPCTLLVDTAAAYIMEKIDFVLVGAEGVVENGGLINQVCSRRQSAVRLC